jgi:hypothetical protein
VTADRFGCVDDAVGVGRTVNAIGETTTRPGNKRSTIGGDDGTVNFADVSLDDNLSPV